MNPLDRIDYTDARWWCPVRVFLAGAAFWVLIWATALTYASDLAEALRAYDECMTEVTRDAPEANPVDVRAYCDLAVREWYELGDTIES